jgi:hypothetical protein
MEEIIRYLQSVPYMVNNHEWLRTLEKAQMQRVGLISVEACECEYLEKKGRKR